MTRGRLFCSQGLFQVAEIRKQLDVDNWIHFTAALAV